MKILIIGGTRFLGKHLVEAAQINSHQITLFNRGISNPDLFPEVEKIYGDRLGDLGGLTGRQWDVAIDTCGYFPRQVKLSTSSLLDSVSHYTFISTISVYKDFSKIGITEEDELAILDEPDTEEVTGQTYGGLKATCEQVASTAFPGSVLIIRPGLIVGPFDPTDRFTYWPWRVTHGGKILAPESPNWCTQFIDVRDLAGWTIRMIENQITGIFNATGPEQPLRFGDLLKECDEATGAKYSIVWVNHEFLSTNHIEPWSELPLWLPGEAYAGMDRICIDKALAFGLRFRPLAQTIRDTLEWAESRPPDYTWRAGLTPDREAELIGLWELEKGAKR